MVNYDSIAAANSSKEDTDSADGLQEAANYAYRKWFGVRRSTWLLLIYTGTYMLFLAMGSLVMRILEEDKEKDMKRQVIQMKQTFLNLYPEVNRSDLELLLSKAYQYKDYGISILDKHLNETNWNFGQGFLFTVTVVTTIGYGHVFPLTADGKLFVIGYAVLGIPFTLIFLTATVQRLLEPTCKILSFFFARLGTHINPFTIKIIHLAFMVIFFMIAFIFIPSALFYVLEPDWTYLDGIYFVFISLTTVGLGDYIPGDKEKHKNFMEIYKSAVAVYLLLGLVFMTLTATVFYDIPQLNLGTVLHQQKDIHLKTSEDEDENDGENERSSLRGSLKRMFKKNEGKVEPS